MFIAHVIPNSAGTQIALGDGSHKHVIEPFDRVLLPAASMKKKTERLHDFLRRVKTHNRDSSKRATPLLAQMSGDTSD